MTAAPGSPEWTARMTASKVAAVLGLSKWDSPLSMWLRMKGLITADETRNAADKSRGHYLEDGVCRWWIDQHPDANILASQQHFVRDGWAAATPDLVAEIDGETVVMDAKTDESEDEWGDEPPAYYVAQIYWQMWCADASIGYIACLFGRPHLRFREWRIERDDELTDAIVARCREFYESLDSDDRPPLDDTVATYEAIRRLHPDIDRDAEATLTEAEAAAYVTTDLDLKAAEAAARAAKTAVLDQMGRARIATCGERVIARRQPNKYGVSLVRVAKTPPAQHESETEA